MCNVGAPWSTWYTRRELRFQDFHTRSLAALSSPIHKGTHTRARAHAHTRTRTDLPLLVWMDVSSFKIFQGTEKLINACFYVIKLSKSHSPFLYLQNAPKGFCPHTHACTQARTHTVQFNSAWRNSYSWWLSSKITADVLRVAGFLWQSCGTKEKSRKFW